MKNRKNKRALSGTSPRNVHKRKKKEEAKRELMRIIDEMGVRSDNVKFGASYDGGRRGRISARAMRDEVTARGIFSSSKSGFGFVEIEGLGRDVFIPEDKTGGAITGDLVEIIYHSYTSRFGEEKTEGRVKKIIEYGRESIIGTLVYEESYYRRKLRRYAVVIPDDAKIYLRPTVDFECEAKDGDKVEARLNRGRGHTDATVIRNFGRADDKGANYMAILAECGIETDFTPAELAEAEIAAAKEINYDGRIDRTGEVIFTIDGEGAKDLDDAISLRRLKNGWRLGVHIADVSYYVTERTALDRLTMARGNSVYFTDKVVPMLPKSLSNGACSLGAGEEKYTLSAIITLSESGEILSTEITPSVIKSRVRGVYSEVNAIFDGSATSAIKTKYKPIIPTLNKMHELYEILLAKSKARGALELESSEAEITLDELGEPMEIKRRKSGDAEKLIEQFMLTANEAVATLLTEKNIPCVFRVHDKPPHDKLSEVLLLLHNLGFNTATVSHTDPTPSSLAQVLREADERGISAPVSYSLLRSMAKARYSAEHSSHFGLSIDKYCHFTSPIRRLSDLATHRIIRRTLFDKKSPTAYSAYARRAAAAATEGELRAVSAERRIENLYKVIYMQKFIGEQFSATVSSLTSFGIFAELENTCEGLIPLSTLGKDFVFDEKTLTVRSKDASFHLGDKISVTLEEADIIRGKLRFSLV